MLKFVQFWWSNVLSSDIETFPQTGPLYGYSPFREIQLYIDDMLAGVAWPYPVVFTGGIVPGSVDLAHSSMVPTY